MENKAFSFNDESYYDDIDYILKKIDDTTTVIYVADKVKKEHKNFLSVDSILDDMANSAWEDAEDISQTYGNHLLNLSKEHKEGLEKVILDYMNEHVPKPDFYHVENVKEYTVEQFKQDFANGN